MISVIADVHLACHRILGGPSASGLNTRAREIAAVLARVARDAPGDLVIAGDLFDTARPTPQLVAAALDALGDRVHTTTALVGNHDQVSTAPGDHALGPLRHAGARVVEAPLVDQGVAWLPYAKGCTEDTTLARLARLLESARYPVELVVLHAGISDQDTPAWLRGSTSAIEVADLAALCAEHGVRAVVAGDWHAQRTWAIQGVQIAQVGALVPTGWDNPGLQGYGGLVTWDGSTLVPYQLPGPRFVDAATPDALAELLDGVTEHTVRARVSSDPRRIDATQEAMAALAARYPCLAGWRVVPTGATVAPMSDPVTTQAPDGIQGYLDSYPLPERLDRARVGTLIREATP